MRVAGHVSGPGISISGYVRLAGGPSYAPWSSPTWATPCTLSVRPPSCSGHFQQPQPKSWLPHRSHIKPWHSIHHPPGLASSGTVQTQLRQQGGGCKQVSDCPASIGDKQMLPCRGRDRCRTGGLCPAEGASFGHLPCQCGGPAAQVSAPGEPHHGPGGGCHAHPGIPPAQADGHLPAGPHAQQCPQGACTASTVAMPLMFAPALSSHTG